jgi:hypothetical protein
LKSILKTYLIVRLARTWMPHLSLLSAHTALVVLSCGHRGRVPNVSNLRQHRGLNSSISTTYMPVTNSATNCWWESVIEMVRPCWIPAFCAGTHKARYVQARGASQRIPERTTLLEASHLWQSGLDQTRLFVDCLLLSSFWSLASEKLLFRTSLLCQSLKLVVLRYLTHSVIHGKRLCMISELCVPGSTGLWTRVVAIRGGCQYVILFFNSTLIVTPFLTICSRSIALRCFIILLSYVDSWIERYGVRWSVPTLLMLNSWDNNLRGRLRTV